MDLGAFAVAPALDVREALLVDFALVGRVGLAAPRFFALPAFALAAAVAFADFALLTDLAFCGADFAFLGTNFAF